MPGVHTSLVTSPFPPKPPSVPNVAIPAIPAIPTIPDHLCPSLPAAPSPSHFQPSQRAQPDCCSSLVMTGLPKIVHEIVHVTLRILCQQCSTPPLRYALSLPSFPRVHCAHWKTRGNRITGAGPRWRWHVVSLPYIYSFNLMAHASLAHAEHSERGPHHVANRPFMSVSGALHLVVVVALR